MRKLVSLWLLMLLFTFGKAQPFGCDINAIRTAFTGAGYVELLVPTQPCSMYFINPTSQSSVLSEAAAQQFGAHTVSFQTAAENNDVLTALYASAYPPSNYAIWIGLGDGANEGTFAWLDGAPLSYLNWAPGEPNNQIPSCCNIPIIGCIPADIRCTQGEDCVQMYGDGKWNDLGCDALSISVIEVNLCPQITSTPDSLICDGTSINLTTSTILGSTPYTYNWSPVSGSGSSLNVTPAANTTYSVRVTDRWGCYADKNINITLQNCVPPPPGCNITAIRNAFTGAGYIELNVLNQPCSMYFINPQSQSSAASEAAAQQFGAHMVSYQTAQENTDVINALNASAYPPSQYFIWIGFSDAASEGNFIWLDGAPVNYTNWAPGEPNNQKPGCCNIPLFGCSGSNPLCSTGEDCVQMYSDGKWNDEDCNGNSISVIEVNLCPQLTIPNNASICSGASVVLTASAILGSTPYTYTWNPGSLPNPSTVSPTQTTTYAVHLTDRWSCVADDSLTVTVQNGAPETFTLNPSPVCENLPVTVTYTGSAAPNASYTWNFDGGTIVSGSGQGPYTIVWGSAGTKNIALDVNAGCPSAQVSQQLTVNPGPVANAGPDVSVCSGGSTQLGAANIAGYTYQWLPVTGLSSASVSDPTYTAVNPGNTPVVTQYILGVMQNGCIDADTVEVTLTPVGTTTITAAGPTSFCSGSSVVISPATVFASYLWNDNSAGNTITATQTGDYYMTGIDANGCSFISDTIPVTVNPAGPTTISAAGPTSFCPGNSVVITADSVFSSYLWNDNSAGNSITATQAGDYYMTGTDANGCAYLSNTITVTIAPNPTLQLDLSRNASCFGLSDGSISISVANGLGNESYTWGTVPPQATSTVTGIAAGSYDVTVTDASNCTATGTYAITEPVQLAVTGTVTPISCFGAADGAIQLTATGGTSPYTYLWSNSSVNNPITNLTEGPYDATVTDANNCTVSATYNIDAVAELVLQVDNVTEINCFGFTDGGIAVSTTGGATPYSYIWSNGSAGATLANLGAGVYNVTVSDNNNCRANTSVILAESAQLNFAALEYNNIKLGEEVQINLDSVSQPGSTYRWNPSLYLSCSDCANPVFSGVRSIEYNVTVTNQGGCSVSGTVKMNVIADKHVFIPNTFTPNGDGYNDFFNVFSAQSVNIFDLTIFNRWGEKVFDSNNMLAGWDGKYNGKEAPPGVYSYVVRLTFIDGESTKKIGTVTVIK